MLTKTDVRNMVTALLMQLAEQRLLDKKPDVYYGYVEPKTKDDGTQVPGYWIGEIDRTAAQERTRSARVYFDAAAEALRTADPAGPFYQALKSETDRCAAEYYEARRHETTVLEHIDSTIAARRQKLVERRAASLFKRLYQRAMAFDWDLYNPAIPQDLRQYVMRQRARGVVSPTSMVLLYLTVTDTISHGEDYSQEAITGHDYQVLNPLVTASLDIDADETQPSKQHRQYIKALQAQTAYDNRPPAHENCDPRDVLADFEYHGLPEQLKSLFLGSPEDPCPHCGTDRRIKIIHAGAGFRYATVCSHYRKGCYIEPHSPIFSTRREVRDWAIVEWATTQAA